MENLKHYLETATKIELVSTDEEEDEHLTFATMDAEQNRMFFASSSNNIYLLQLPENHESSFADMHAPHVFCTPVLESGDCISALEYLMEKEGLVIGTRDGYLLLHTLDVDTTVVVGRVDGGVKSIVASPDGGLLAIASGLEQLIVMTQDWDVLYEVMLNIDRQQQENIANCVHDISAETQISWRGDGKFLATLVSGGSFSTQQVRIWDRESGALLSSSEEKLFMAAALDWMPSGAKIVAAYNRIGEGKCPLVVCFERNGLERTSFSIDDEINVKIDLLKWSSNSELLASLSRCAEHDSVRIWCFSNSRWYLKQGLRFSKKDLVRFCWDPIKPLHLVCWTSRGKITSHSFAWVTAVTNESICYLIDNRSILVTPLSICLMPPPLSFFSLKFPNVVTNIAVLSMESGNRLSVSLADGNICVHDLPTIDAWENLEGKEICIQPAYYLEHFSPIRHMTWLDSSLLLVSGLSESGQPSGDVNAFKNKEIKRHFMNFLQEIELFSSEETMPDKATRIGWHANGSNKVCVEEAVISLDPNPVEKGSAFVQFVGGSLLEYHTKCLTEASNASNLKAGNSLSASCPLVKVVPALKDDILVPFLIGMDSAGTLRACGRVLCFNCSSFSLYSASPSSTLVFTHVLFTTKQDFLHIISIDDVLHGKVGIGTEKYPGNVTKGDMKENKDVMKLWERSTKVVTLIHGDEATVILQTPRGSLECIYPRKLVLMSIVNALTQSRFQDAVDMIRRHRIDYNIIVDHCGCKHFVDIAPEFIKKIKNLTHITDFVCSVTNENVMETLYKNALPAASISDVMTHKDGMEETRNQKVSSVLCSIRKALEDHVPTSPARELCILTTLARSEPPELEEALQRIKCIREVELLEGRNEKDIAESKLHPSAEEALKHLLWLSDSDAVYEAALGLYDLNLAAMVALNSQKDPKEFLPYLQELEQMEPAIMRYTIDIKLRKYKSALLNMVSAGDDHFEDCLNIIKKNPSLFALGIQLFLNSSKQNRVVEAWGDHLFDQECFEDAASAYLYCSSLEKALKAYREFGHWRGVLSVAGLLKFTPEKISQLAHELCEELHALGKSAEAARVALEYCHDVQSGLTYFIHAREWEEALRTATLYARDDLVSEVQKAVTECAKATVTEYEEGVVKVGKYVARYLAVRQRRLLLASKLQADDRSVADDMDYDAVSEASSSFSEMSAYTQGKGNSSAVSIASSGVSKTSKNRRQRNRGKIRAGSPSEETALSDHLKGMKLTSTAERELKLLLGALTMFRNVDSARKLQNTVNNFELAQSAAVKLAEDCLLAKNMDADTHTLEYYIEKVQKENKQQPASSWQSKVLQPPPPSWKQP